MTWWQWTVVGGILLGAELLGVDAQFYLIFVGLSALLVGLAELLGIAMPLWVQVAVFAVFSLLFLYAFRRTLDTAEIGKAAVNDHSRRPA